MLHYSYFQLFNSTERRTKMHKLFVSQQIYMKRNSTIRSTNRSFEYPSSSSKSFLLDYLFFFLKRITDICNNELNVSNVYFCCFCAIVKRSFGPRIPTELPTVNKKDCKRSAILQSAVRRFRIIKWNIQGEDKARTERKEGCEKEEEKNQRGTRR